VYHLCTGEGGPAGGAWRAWRLKSLDFRAPGRIRTCDQWIRKPQGNGTLGGTFGLFGAAVYLWCTCAH
jgi:hypothetical protein